MSSTILPGSGTRSQTIDLTSAVRHQSWLWLREIERRLDFVAEILDDQGALCAMAPRNSSVPTWAAALPPAPLSAAVHGVLRSNQTQRLTHDGVSIVCAPLSAGRGAVGVLVLSRAPNRLSSDRSLDDIASWLGRAVQAHLNLPVDESDAFDRVSSLHKLLQDVIEGGSEQEVIAAFAEALIAWDDLEVRGYVQDVHGQLTLSAATPGIDRQAAAVLTLVPFPIGGALTRLSPAESHRAGLRHDRDVFVAPLAGPHSQPWCIVLSGAIRPEDEPRLSLYVDLLRGALDRTATIAETRVSWAILQQLLSASGDPAETGLAALDDLRVAIDAHQMGMQVSGARAARRLTIGDSTLFATTGPTQVDQLVSVVSVGDGETMTIRAQRAPGRAFTRREQQIVDRTAAIFSAWLSGVRKRSSAPVERRAEHREFQAVIDRLVEQNLREGFDVAVIVLHAASGVSTPGLLQQWVGDIRGRLRSGDAAGALSEREIGIFLAGAGARDVARVSTRIRQQVLAAAGSEPITMGVAGRSAGEVAEISLVREARQDAARRHSHPQRGASE